MSCGITYKIATENIETLYQASIRINNTRYTLNSKLVYIDKAEADDYLMQLNSKDSSNN